MGIIVHGLCALQQQLWTPDGAGYVGYSVQKFDTITWEYNTTHIYRYIHPRKER